MLCYVKRDNPGNEVGQPAIAIESRYMEHR